MKTVVVNIRKEKYDVYCGRYAGTKLSIYGNPHIIGYCQICDLIHDRESCIKAFKKDFDKKIEIDDEFKRKILELKGKRLGCFCKSKKSSELKNGEKDTPCHCDVYVEYLEGVGGL